MADEAVRIACAKEAEMFEDGIVLGTVRWCTMYESGAGVRCNVVGRDDFVRCASPRGAEYRSIGDVSEVLTWNMSEIV
jgi:hypothetical protein